MDSSRSRREKVRSKKHGARGSSRSVSPKRTDSRLSRDKMPKGKDRARRSKSRSRSPINKSSRSSKKRGDQSLSSSKKASPMSNRKKSRKRSVSAPRSPSPPASPSPPQSPSENRSDIASPDASIHSDASSTSSSRREKSKSSRKQKKRDKKRRKGTFSYDDVSDFDGDHANGSPMDDEKYPDIGEIYEAVVAAIKPFGFFCLMMGLRHKYYGLVHISEMKRDGYVTNVDEVVQMGQTVFVKVIQNHPKIALSLKDVDQETGEDLDVKRTLKLMEDPDFLDKEKNVRQNRGNGLVISGLQYSNESEYRELIANLLVNEMNLPATPDHIGYCQPVQGIEFRKKGCTTQLVKIRFYEDDSVPFNRDDVLSRYMALRNINLWRHKEIVLNPELRTMGAPRPKLRESLLSPGDFLPQAPGQERRSREEIAAVTAAADNFVEDDEAEARGFIPLPQLSSKSKDGESDSDDELKLPKRAVPTASTKPFTQDVMSQIANRVRASLGNILKPATKFELPRTFTSMPPPPPSVSVSSAQSSAPTGLPSPSVAGSKQHGEMFHSAPPPPVNLPTSVNLSVPPPKLTISIQGLPPQQKASAVAPQMTLQQQIAASAEFKGVPGSIQYPSLPQFPLNQPPPPLGQPLGQGPPFQAGALPSHLAALQQQFSQSRFSAPPPVVRPPANTGPIYSIPPLLGPSGARQQTQPRPGPERGPYTSSAQAQQHLQALLNTLTAGGRDPSALLGPRTDALGAIPPLLGHGSNISSLQQQIPQQQQHQQQQQPPKLPVPSQQQQNNPYALPSAARWDFNPYALGASSFSNMSSPKDSLNKISSANTAAKPSASTSSVKESGKEKSEGEIVQEKTSVDQLLSLAKKLGFSVNQPSV